MYLILQPFSTLNGQPIDIFSGKFTPELEVVCYEMKNPNVRVYKLDSLTELKDIEVSYNEITKEME